MTQRLEDAFLQEVIAHPDDDGPRLVYADWLDDRGDEVSRARAELIRLQCQLARMEDAHQPFAGAASCSGGMAVCTPQSVDLHAAFELRVRCRRILKEYGKHWALPHFSHLYEAMFRRGFLESAHLEGRQGLQLTEELFRRHPVRELLLQKVDDSLESVLRFPCLSRLHTLRIVGHMSPELGLRNARLVAGAASLAGLRELSLPYQGIGPEGLRALVDSPHLARLERLDLYGCQVGAEGLRALATATHWDRLTGLGLGVNFVHPPALEQLAHAPHLRGLRVLHLATDDVNGIAALARSPQWMGLTVLDLSGSGITERGAEALASADNFRSLRVLELCHNRLRSRGVQALTSSDALANLRFLGLMECEVGSPGLRALAEAPHLGQLQALDLNGNRIAHPGVRALARSPHLRSLQWLGLGGNRFDHQAAQALADASANLPSLRRVELSFTPDLGTAGGLALLDAPGRQYHVHLYGTRVSDEVKRQLEGDQAIWE